MTEMSEEIMDLIRRVPCCYLATASKDGVPSVGPVSLIEVADSRTVIIAASGLETALENLRGNPKAAILVHSDVPPRSQASLKNLMQVRGGQIKGTASVLTSGDVHERAKKMTSLVLGPDIAERVTTIVFRVEELHGINPVRDTS